MVEGGRGGDREAWREQRGHTADCTAVSRTRAVNEVKYQLNEIERGLGGRGAGGGRTGGEVDLGAVLEVVLPGGGQLEFLLLVHVI